MLGLRHLRKMRSSPSERQRKRQEQLPRPKSENDLEEIRNFKRQLSQGPDTIKPRRNLSHRIKGLFLPTESKVIPNFHEVAPNKLYRGVVPATSKILLELKDRGITTVIDLRNDKSSDPKELEGEKRWLNGLGIKYENIQMTAKEAPMQSDIKNFLDLIEKSGENEVFYVHCKQGIDRTGVMAAAYMVTNGSSAEEAYKEMKNCGYDQMHKRKFKEQKHYVKYGGLETDLAILGKKIKIDEHFIPLPKNYNKKKIKLLKEKTMNNIAKLEELDSTEIIDKQLKRLRNFLSTLLEALKYNNTLFKI